MKRMFSRAIALGGLLALAATQASAEPAVPESRTFTQPDGTVITGTLRGDEWLSWYRTSDGKLFIRNPQTKAFEYAVLSERNGQRSLVSVNQRVGSGLAPPATVGGTVSDETLYAMGADERRRAGVQHAGAHAHTLSAPHAPAFSARALGPRSFKTLIVMVEFSDIQITSPTSTWAAKIFGMAEGQLNHYYDQNSYGKARFDPATETEGTANDGFVRVRLNYPHPDPRADWERSEALLAEALMLTDAWVDFSTYDTNSDGRVSGDELQVGFLVAGGSASRGDEKSIWAHSGYFTATDPVVLDGVRVASENGSRYFTWGDRQGDHDATLGVIAHEIGHSAFMLPDLYPNLEYWDLMAFGVSGRKSNEPWPGQTPVGMSAHTRWMAGFIDATWVDPMYLGTTHSLHRALSATPNLVITTLPNATGSYFALEHRRIEGYDLGMASRGVLAGHSGVLVLVQTNSAIGLDLVRAGTSGDTRQLFYPGHNDRLAPDTTPNTHHPVDGTVSGIIFSNIAHSGDAMSVRIGRAPTTPGADCRLFTASLSAHVTAGRAYTVTTGTWWKTTTYHAVGSGESLGTLATTQVTLKETPAGHFSRGTSCPDQNAPVFSEVQVTPDGPRARIGGRVGDVEKDLVRVDVEVDARGTWQRVDLRFDESSTQTPWHFNHTIDGLAQGQYSYRLRAIDSGNRVTLYGPFQFTVEGPRAPTCTITRVHRDSEGYYAAWGNFSDPDFGIPRVDVSLDGGEWRQAFVNWEWTVRLSRQPNDLANGIHTVLARVTDDTGLTGMCGPFELEVGVNHAPTAAITSVSRSRDSINLDGSVADVDGDIAGVEVEFDGNGQWQAATGFILYNAANGAWYEQRTGLAVGVHTVRVRGVDAAGLRGGPGEPFAFEVFAPEPPVCVIHTVDLSQGFPYVTGSVTDRNNDIESVESFLIDHGTWQYMTYFGGEFFAMAAEVNPLAGRHIAQIRVTDTRGDVGYCSKEFVVGAAPTLGPVQVATSGLTVTVSGTAADADSDLTTVELQYDDEFGPWVSATGTTSWSHGNGSLGAGQHRVRVRARDAAGLTSASSEWRSFTLSSASCFTAANTAHAAAGRATLKYSVLYYANGSNDYLGMGTATTSLLQQGTNNWKKVTSCP